MSGLLPSRRLYYGWAVVGVIFWTFVFLRGANAAFGVFYVALINDLGWSHAGTAAAFSISALVASMSGVVVGLAIDRVGPRRVMPLGALVVALGFALTSQIGQLWQFYATYGVLVAFGTAGLGFGTTARLISSWFRRLRGTAFGIAMAGAGIGNLIVVPVAQLAVERIGWRTAYLLIAGVIVVLVPVIVALVRERPEDLGLHPDGDPAPHPASGPASAAASAAGPAGELSRSQQHAFWLLLIAEVFSGTAVMVDVHQVAYLIDRGFTPIVAASAVGAAGLLAATGQLSAGVLSDRLGRRRPLFVAAGLFSASTAALLALRGPADGWLLILYVILYGLSIRGFGTVCGTILTDILHGKRLGFLVGFVVFAHSVGGAVGTWLAGAVHDQVGSYGIVFALPGGLIFLSALAYSLALAVWERPAVHNLATQASS
ncbi:MAG: MFS transporter [Chloroflexi bacterium]|nr:MFS transporter [Chloroflexota bacterium]